MLLNKKVVQSQQQKHQKKLWNMLKVSTKLSSKLATVTLEEGVKYVQS